MIKETIQQFFKKNPTLSKPKMKSVSKNSNKLAQSAGAMEIYNSPKMVQERKETKQKEIQNKSRNFLDSYNPSKKMTPNNKPKMPKQRYFA